MNQLKNLFLNELADILDAEQRVVKLLVLLSDASVSRHLKSLLQAHILESEIHIQKVNQVFTQLGERAKTKTCHAMVGLVKEAEAVLSEYKGSLALDAAIVCATQKLEHYEIVTYGCLREWAELLGEHEATRLLQSILYDEKYANKLLTDVAIAQCNSDSMGGIAISSK